MERLKRLRSEKGLSQAKLAARADLDPSTVNQIERGAREASPPTLRKLADALNVSMADLLDSEATKSQGLLSRSEQRAARQHHEGLIRAHQAATRLGRLVVHSLPGFQHMDVSLLFAFEELCHALELQRDKRELGEPEAEEMARAIEYLQDMQELVHKISEERIKHIPAEWRRDLEVLREGAQYGIWTS